MKWEVIVLRHKQRGHLDVVDVMDHANSNEGVTTLGSLVPLVESRHGGLVVGVAEAIRMRKVRSIRERREGSREREREGNLEKEREGEREGGREGGREDREGGQEARGGGER